MTPRYLDVAGAATYLSLTENAVRMMVKRAEIPHVKLGVRVRFDVQRLDAWVQKQARRA